MILIIIAIITIAFCAYMIKESPVDNSMSFIEAIKAMNIGYKVYHKSFKKGAFIRHMSEELYIDEDSKIYSESDIWYIYRKQEYERGWYIVK